jgi:putative phosphoesterase
VKVGLISDTHGLLRPEALAALRDSDRIIHAGDIGKAQVLAALEAIAPLTVVRGNNDTGPWAASIPQSADLIAGSVRVHVIHDLAELDIDPAAAGYRVVVSGHSHKPARYEKDGVLYVNPGSAGPRRFRLPVSVGVLHVTGSEAAVELVELVLS